MRLSAHVFVSLSDCLLVWLFVRLFLLHHALILCLSVHIFVSLLVCLIAILSVSMYIYLRACELSVCLYIYLNMCLSVYLPEYVSVRIST